MKEVADYYARLVSWYTQGGFTDEYGQRHDSGHHHHIAYWEVLNEIDFEHKMTPEFYTRLYDAIVEAIHGVDPKIKFVALALAAPAKNPAFFEYFLNPKNHKPGVPLDMISYHFYASPAPDENPGVGSTPSLNKQTISSTWSATLSPFANVFPQPPRLMRMNSGPSSPTITSCSARRFPNPTGTSAPPCTLTCTLNSPTWASM